MSGLVNILVFVIISLVSIVSIWGILPLAFLVFMTYYGAQSRAEKASEQLSKTLMGEEYIEAEAIQFRVFALWNRRAAVGITNSRILVVKRGLFGGFTMVDIQWKDLEDVTIEQNVLSDLCGSNLKFKHLNSKTGEVEVKGVDSEVAATIYSKAQAQEQAWEEKRRVRKMEEVRAAAGGVVVHTGNQQAESGPKNSRMLEEITTAKALLDSGAISDAEFQEMKAKILAAA
jgi:Short C-terminal domain/Bacterial PH domain